MDFEPSEDQIIFRESVRRFAQDNLAEGALERARAPGYPWDVAKLMSEQGLLGITMPEEDGGQGGTLMDAVLAIEQVALVCPRSSDVIQAGNFGPARTLAEYGTPEQKKKVSKARARRCWTDFDRHDRAGCRISANRSQDQREARWQWLPG